MSRHRDYYQASYTSDFPWGVLLTLFAVVVLLIISFSSCNTQPEKLPDVTLPNGQVVEAYGFMRNGRYHTIYTAKDKTVTTDNSVVNKHSQTDIEIK